MLAPSRILRPAVKRAGGGRSRTKLVEKSYEMIAQGSKSFASASKLFDRATRERVWMLYAWCRRCDDITDGQDLGGALSKPRSPAERSKAIRVLTRRALEGEPTAELAFDAFGQVAAECGLTMEMAEDVIAGFALDAEGWRPRTDADLARYCYHVAGAVGVMMARVMGVPAMDSFTMARACDLGIAFQLANIARDMAEDDAADRCYIPAEWLAEEDIEPGQLMKPHHRREASDIARRLAVMMDRHLRAARLGTTHLPFRSRWAVLAAANIYGEIGYEVDRLATAAWDHRVVISKPRKLWLIAQAFFEALWNRPAPPDTMPEWKYEDILIDVRMRGEIPKPEYKPLPDEE